MQTLAKTIHGSRLYGLDGPDSDFDFKGIHLPSMEDCILGRACHHQNNSSGEGSGKTEWESFSLQEFLKLAARGEDVAITMLHCLDSQVLEDSGIFAWLRQCRSKFYTKRMTGSLGYAKNQASKYALRADRMVAVESVISVLEEMERDGVARLGQAWDWFVEGNHVKKTVSLLDRSSDKRVLDVAGKLLPATITPVYGLDILYRLRDSYGERVRTAKSMEGKDLKAVSHSFRVGYQLFHIFKDGDFSFPLPETPFLRDLKFGRLDFVQDKLDDKLNMLILEVEMLAEKSSYPEKVDQEWLDNLVLGEYDY